MKVITFIKKSNAKEKDDKVSQKYILDTCKTMIGLNLKGEKPKEYKDSKNNIDVFYLKGNKLVGKNQSCVADDDPIRELKAKKEEITEEKIETYAAGTITREEMKMYNDKVGELSSFDKFRDTYCTIAKIMTSVIYNLVETIKKPINFFSFNSKKGITELIVLNRLIRQGILINKVISI